MKIKKPDEITRARMRKKMEERIAAAREHAEVAPQRFLDAWKKGVGIIGKSYFKCETPLSSNQVIEPAESLEAVTSKWQVCPDYDYIMEHIGVLSGGEAALLVTMCSFYNSGWGGDLMRECGLNGMADVAAKLDLEETQIVAELLLYYTGW